MGHLFDYSRDLYDNNPENYHKEFWKQVFALDKFNGHNEKWVETASKYLDKCKKYIETHDVNDDEECAVYPIVLQVLDVDNRWPEEDFSVRRIINSYNNYRTKVSKKYKDRKIDIQAQSCLETANHFSTKNLMKL